MSEASGAELPALYTEIDRLTSENDLLRGDKVFLGEKLQCRYEEIDRLKAERAFLKAEGLRLINICIKQDREISQVLGEALAYPKYKDDQANFPGATEADGVVIGPDTAESLAEMAAKEIERLRAEYTRQNVYLDTVEDEVVQLRVRVAELEQAISSTTNDLPIVAQQLEETTRETIQLEARVAELEQEEISLQVQIEGLEASRDHYRLAWTKLREARDW